MKSTWKVVCGVNDKYANSSLASAKKHWDLDGDKY
jgi:hypothetical protein